jgi:hypothetical protein
MAPLRQGEEGLWFDNSAALLPVYDQLAGVGQALHLTDASAYRVGPVGADVPFGGYNEPRCAPLGPWPVDVVAPFQADQLVSNHGEFHTSPMQAVHSNGLLNINSNEVTATPSVVSLRSPSNNSDGEGPFKCTNCDKSMRRRCELKYADTISSHVPYQ